MPRVRPRICFTTIFGCARSRMTESDNIIIVSVSGYRQVVCQQELLARIMVLCKESCCSTCSYLPISFVLPLLQLWRLQWLCNRQIFVWATFRHSFRAVPRLDQVSARANHRTGHRKETLGKLELTSLKFDVGRSGGANNGVETGAYWSFLRV